MRHHHLVSSSVLLALCLLVVFVGSFHLVLSVPILHSELQAAPASPEVWFQLEQPDLEVGSELEFGSRPGNPEPRSQVVVPNPGIGVQDPALSPLTAELQISGESGRLTDPAGLPDEIVSTWNEHVVELDELTRCIRGSEAGNAIERWLVCLEAIEEKPSFVESGALLKPLEDLSHRSPDSLAAQQLGVSEGGDAEASSNLDPSEEKMVFDPLSGATSRSSDLSSSSLEGLASTGVLGALNEDVMSAAGSSEEGAKMDLVEHSGASKEVKSQGGAGLRAPESGKFMDSEVEVNEAGRKVGGFFLESSESQSAEDHGRMSYVDTELVDRDALVRIGGGDVEVSGLDSGLKSESSRLCANTQAPLSSMDTGDFGIGREVSSDGANSLKSTNGNKNLMDALKLAACLGAAVTLIWRKKVRSGAHESLPSEQIEEYPRPSATGFSMTGHSSSNTAAGYPNVRAGSLPGPLGMAIATVMAEVLEHEHSQREPRSADELSNLLEAAMTESLSPVMGVECTGFVEQFKQSFRSTYRLIGSVRSASAKNLARPSFTKRNARFTKRQSPRRDFRCMDDEDKYSTGVSSLSRGAQPDMGVEGGQISSHGRADSQVDLAEQFSRLTFSGRRPEDEAKNLFTDSIAPSSGTQSLGFSVGGASSHVDQEPYRGLGDKNSILRRNVSDRLSGKSREEQSSSHGSQSSENVATSRLGRGGLEQSANGSNADCIPPQLSRPQAWSSLESCGFDLAIQPFGVNPPVQLVSASENEEMIISSQPHHRGAHLQEEMLHVWKRQNYLKEVELSYKFQGLSMKEVNLHLTSESNSLMRENVGLSRNKAEWRESEFQDRKLAAAYSDFTRRCADELVAGLCVMLCALFFGAWNYSYTRLFDVVAPCQYPSHEKSNSMFPGINKVVDSLHSLTSQVHIFICEVTIASRMFLGLGLISIVAATLLRKSMISSSQAMPATILIIVLGGICGIAGKFAVDSMGGSGYHWLLMWETLCFIHMSATCFTSFLYWILNGTPESLIADKQNRQYHVVSPWLRRLVFHGTLVLVLPTLAGLLPFAPVREIMRVLGVSFWDLAFSPVQSFVREKARFLLL